MIWDEGMRSWVVVDYGRFRYVGSNQAVFTNAYAKQNPLFIEIECGPNTTPMQGEGRAAASAGRFSGVNDDGLPRNLKGAR
ncbi:hypothetical protein A5641_13605 [Mycobacterium sp. 1554424.7]|nr:hypothetical protein A5641_13605 [Mycobacterium sp. 1554424.7]